MTPIAPDLCLSPFEASEEILLGSQLIALPWRRVTPNKLRLSSLLLTLSTTLEALEKNAPSW